MTLEPTPDAKEWEPWTPKQLRERFGSCPALWGVAGGWALDLWLGRTTRSHSDLEIAISGTALSLIRERLAGHLLYSAKDGLLSPLDDVAPAEVRQVWVLDPQAQKWRLDVMLDPGDESLWIYRRDGRVKAPRLSMLGSTACGIPYLRPQVVLLFKGKQPRPKDNIDFATCLEVLDQSERNWLSEALLTAHPQSPWLDVLSKPAAS